MVEYSPPEQHEEITEFKNFIVRGFHLVRRSHHLSYPEKAEALDKLLSII